MQCVVIVAALLKNLILAGMCITITVYKLEEYMEKGKKRWKKSCWDCMIPVCYVSQYCLIFHLHSFVSVFPYGWSET